MKTLEDLRRRISNAGDMKSVVSTMKMLAAVNIRQYESAAEATGEFNETIELALQILLREKEIPSSNSHVTSHEKKRQSAIGLVVFGSDQGLCGQFNSDIAGLARTFLQQHLPQREAFVMTIGGRVNSYLEEPGVAVNNTFHGPANVSGITTLLQDIMPLIENWQSQKGIERIDVFYNRRLTSASYLPTRQLLLPLSMEWLNELKKKSWDSRSLPIHVLPWQELFSEVIRQYLFINLFRACAESRASENASRIASMHRAEKKIEQRLNDLQFEFNQHRQRSITEELLDIMSGFEAVSDRD